MSVNETFKYYVNPEAPPSVSSSPITFKSSLLTELLNGDTGGLTSNVLGGVAQIQGLRKQIHRAWEKDPEEEQEMGMDKIDIARSVFTHMLHAPTSTRKGIIHTMMKRAHITHSTAVSYYERLAKEAGITNTNQFGKDDDDQPMTAGNSAAPVTGTPGVGDDSQNQTAQEQPQNGEVDAKDPQNQEVQHTFPDNPNKQGIIRTVQDAHLVYKRQTPDGTFEELWIYNIGPDMRDELTVRRNILAGTDIPAQKTQSPDGSESYSLTTLGNAQMMMIKGLNQ